MYTATLSDSHRLSARTATLLTQLVNCHLIASDAVVTSLEYTRKGNRHSLTIDQLARAEGRERAKTARKLLTFA